MDPLTLAALISGGTALVKGIGNYFSQRKASKSSDKAVDYQKDKDKIIDGQQEQLQNWYDRNYNEDTTQRADAQRLLNYTAEQIKQRNKRAAGTQAVMGGTEESVAAEKEANSKALAEAASSIAASGVSRKDSIDAAYQQGMQGIASQRMGQQDAMSNIEMNRAKNLSAAGNALQNTDIDVASIVKAFAK
ncbi:MAG: hypothetical protein IJV36_02490 [Prevotella sp.]|nr:hypothetical protein [Prevotella sp.]